MPVGHHQQSFLLGYAVPLLRNMLPHLYNGDPNGTYLIGVLRLLYEITHIKCLAQSMSMQILAILSFMEKTS